MPIPFIILADLRTGSTLLSSSLNSHPQVHCLGELLHEMDFADNQLPATDRHSLNGSALVARALTMPGSAAAGFRAMVSLPTRSTRPQWADAWQALAQWPGLRVILLRRQDTLAQYASLCMALRTGCFTPSPENPLLLPENRPRLHLSATAMTRWIRQRQRLYALRQAQLGGNKPHLALDYESLSADWPGQIRRIQHFLGVEPLELKQLKGKQEQRPLPEVVSNYQELRAVQQPWKARQLDQY